MQNYVKYLKHYEKKLYNKSQFGPIIHSKGSLQNKNRQNYGNFFQRGGGQIVLGVIPKFYLGIYLEGGGVGPGGKIPLNCLEFLFLGYSILSHAH